jgi:hypothetical protein
VIRYRRNISAPLLDRIDIQIVQYRKFDRALLVPLPHVLFTRGNITPLSLSYPKQQLDEIRMPDCIEQLAQEAKHHHRLVDLSTDAWPATQKSG